MELSNKLKEQGWHFTEDGIKKLTTTAGTDERKIISTAMDMDFRDIAGGALPSKREETIPGRIVLQLQKTRNISAPKSNEESKAAPKFLQLDLSDGQSTIKALELESVPALSLDIPPGTKIFFKAERIQLMQGYIVLRPTELQILGGKVEALVKKWEFARTTQQYARMGHRLMNSSSGGPPPWIPFGQKMENKEVLTNDRNFKSLQAATDKDKETKENEEFNTMRSEAIAEATKTGAKKIFGGGSQQILDHNVKKILEKGYTDDEAKQALRATNNNLERALYNLKRRRESNASRSTQGTTSAPSKGGRNSLPRETGSKRGAASAKEEAAAAKPAGNVSLFDFLTEKLPANSDTTASTTIKPAAPSTNVSQVNQNAPSTSANSKFIKSKTDPGKLPYNSSNKQNEPNSTRPKFENNISSSFAANRTSSSSQQNERDSRDSRDERGRYSNSRGGGGGGKSGRGGYNNNSSYKPNNKTYEDEARTKTENDYYSQRGGGGGNYNANNRNSRNSYERSQPPQRNNNTNSNTNKDRNTQEETFNKFDNRRNNNQNYQKPNRANDRYGNTSDNKNYDRNRYNQNDNGRTHEGANRSQSNYNNSAKTATTQATTSAEAAATMPKSTANNSKNGNNNAGNNTDFNSNMNKIVDATAKMKIDKSREQGKTQTQQSVPPHQQHNKHQHNQQNFSQQPQTYNQSQQNQQQQQQQQPQTVISHYVPAQYVQQPIPTSSPNQNAGNYTQLPYDPSKIIGFQNKQANDFAMSLLKSQGLPNSMPNAPQPHQQQQQTVVPPMQPPSPFAANTFVVPNPQTSMPPTPQAAATQFGMVPGDSWLWKIGDLCMAKYWDDGRYYEAEITAVSNKTCVVFFLGYGNHEEVLKTDCLPITDVNNRPINSYNPMLQQQHQAINIAPVPAATAPPPIQTSQRYRYERQMYVPPHKRKN